MLIVEDGTGLPDANAYISVAYASAYWAARGNTAWFGGAFTLATGTLTFGGNPAPGDTVTIGTTTYAFKTEADEPTDVEIGADVAASRMNFLAVARGNKDVSLMADGVADVVATARAGGYPGNDVATSATGAALSWAAPTLSGGTQTISLAQQETAIIQATQYVDLRTAGNLRGWPLNAEQALAFPRTGLNASCTKNLPLPPGLLDATAEYAVRALKGPLLPDPTVDPSGYAVTRRREKVGPLEREYEFAAGTGSSGGRMLDWPLYPSADKLLSCMLINPFGSSQGRVIRA